MNTDPTTRTIERLLRQQAALATFGSFAFVETDLTKILMEAARICAECLSVPFTKICRYRPSYDDLLVVAGHGWDSGVVGNVISQADETSTQGRAYITGEPVILEDINKNNSYALPEFYLDHGIVSTVDVLIKGKNGPFGVLEADCASQHTFDQHDINFLTGFANVVAEAASTAERAATLQSTLENMQTLISEKEILLEEKNVLAAELQHRVRNNLQLIYSMLIRQIELSDTSNREGMRAIARRVMSLANIYDHLLDHGLVQTIDFGAYLKSLCLNLQEFHEQGIFNVSLICEAESMSLDLDMVTTLGIIVTEVTSNSYLHGFPDKAGTIKVTLTQNDQSVRLEIADDGIGFVQPKTSKRHGVGLISRLMKQAGGTAELVSDRGTKWVFIFPLKTEAVPPNDGLQEQAVK